MAIEKQPLTPTDNTEEYLYVFPDLSMVDDSNELESKVGFERSKYVEKIEYLFEEKFLIILSEPGAGKSRLLKELTLSAGKNNLNSFFLDLKKINNQEIVDVFTKYIKFQNQLPKSNKEIDNIYDFFPTSNFKLNASLDDILVCLDAFDEVGREAQYDVIEKIKKFKFSFPQAHIIISCRDYIFKKFKRSFNDLEPKIIIIRPFSKNKVVQFFTRSSFKTYEIEKVLDHFYRGFQLNLIDNPRTL